MWQDEVARSLTELEEAKFQTIYRMAPTPQLAGRLKSAREQGMTANAIAAAVSQMTSRDEGDRFAYGLGVGAHGARALLELANVYRRLALWASCDFSEHALAILTALKDNPEPEAAFAAVYAADVPLEYVGTL